MIPLLLLLVSQAVSADYPIEVIELKSRPLEEILPVIRPLIGADGTATGMGNNLVLKASPEQVREVRQLLREIDRPPKRLLITVSKQGESTRGSSGYSAGADIRAGDGQISINSPGRAVDETRARVHIYGTNGQQSRTTGQQVQALEGRPAFIASGTRIPVRDVERYNRHGRIRESYVTRMYDASSGFYVVPRVSGEYVTLEIHQRDDRPGRYRGIIDTQSTDTVVRGRLGEWVSLGGINTTGNSSQGGLGRSQATDGSVMQQIEVMVQCLDCEGSTPPQRGFLPQLQGFE
ncbi:MAG: secretin N-terminal domain-containing protein [Gammaproteobacteria bacterium]